MQKINTTNTKEIKGFANGYLIYTRKSTDDPDNQKNSIEYQVMEARRFANKESLPIAGLTLERFCENGIVKEHHSGFKESALFEILPDGSEKQKVERPKFLVLADLLQKRYFKGVICLCWDRISRNKSDDVIIDKLLAQDVDVRFVQASYERTSAGILHRDVDGVFSRHYSRAISEKVRNTAKKLRAEGKCIYHAPIGYLDEGSDSKPFDPKRAPLVKKVFELYATGEWSCKSLSVWANQQGLTTKPFRRQRTHEERLAGLEIKTIPKMCRPVTHKSIENMLKNPFYIGKLVYDGTWECSNAHLPLIDTDLFLRVQKALKSKTVSVHYPDKLFFLYRRLLTCGGCGRSYSPYTQKGIAYYRSKCKSGCINTSKNINEDFITEKILEVFEKIHFCDGELEMIEKDAEKELEKITARRNAELESLYRQYNKALADYDYLAKERLTLMRTSIMMPEEVLAEEIRLKSLTNELQVKIRGYSESSRAILDYVITFSEIAKNAELYFQGALDSDKSHIAHEVFSELKIINGELKYTTRPSYNALLKRHFDPSWQLGSPNYLFSELSEIHYLVRQEMDRIKNNIH